MILADGPSGGRGKWSQAGVPHKGWVCDNVEDLGTADSICEMCETVHIRFIHYMSNTRYPDVLGCGEICAGHMEGNLAGAQLRDKKMRSNAGRRQHFPNRKGWTVNSKGNHVLRAGEFRVTIFRKSRGPWGGVVSPRGYNQQGTFIREKFLDLDAAKRAAFDTLMFLEENRPKRMLWQPDL